MTCIKCAASQIGQLWTTKPGSAGKQDQSPSANRRNSAANSSFPIRLSAMAIIAACSSLVARRTVMPLIRSNTKADAIPARLLPSMNDCDSARWKA